jgi:hypothetical protein
VLLRIAPPPPRPVQVLAPKISGKSEGRQGGGIFSAENAEDAEKFHSKMQKGSKSQKIWQIYFPGKRVNREKTLWTTDRRETRERMNPKREKRKRLDGEGRDRFMMNLSWLGDLRCHAKNEGPCERKNAIL